MTALVEGGGREGRVSRLRVAVDALVTGCAVHVRITVCADSGGGWGLAGQWHLFELQTMSQHGIPV